MRGLQPTDNSRWHANSDDDCNCSSIPPRSQDKHKSGTSQKMTRVSPSDFAQTHNIPPSRRRGPVHCRQKLRYRAETQPELFSYVIRHQDAFDICWQL
jgi:hypothetical protein